MAQKYFFDQDGDSHWYMIPAEKRERWDEVNEMDSDSEESWDAFSEFEDYRLGCGITQYEFENPKKLEK